MSDEDLHVLSELEKLLSLNFSGCAQVEDEGLAVSRVVHLSCFLTLYDVLRARFEPPLATITNYESSYLPVLASVIKPCILHSRVQGMLKTGCAHSFLW